MDHRIVLVFVLTVIIHMIATLGYAVRLAGVRTQRLALAFSLWNVIYLAASTANTIQAPFLGRIIDEAGSLLNRGNAGILQQVGWEIRLVILAGTLGAVIGTLLLPAFVRFFTRGIMLFERVKSIPKMVGILVRPGKLKSIINDIDIPKVKVISNFVKRGNIPRKLIALNFIVTGIWTIGVLSALYAGLLDTRYVRTTANMSGLINGVATIMGVLLIDPHVASVTDEAARGLRSDEDVKTLSMYLAFSRIAGTILAQFLFVPAAQVIVMIARIL